MTRKLRLILIPAVLVAVQPLPALAQSPVDSAQALVHPRQYDGPCPPRLQFIAIIAVNRPTVVTYRWERSDRWISSIESVDIEGAAQSVVATWTPPLQPGQAVKGWQQLHILSPTDFVSNAVPFSMTCR